jgi:phosphohistidine phosphatase
MPALLLLRHGKSDWKDDPGVADRDRPLARRGQNAARAIGKLMARAGQIPDAAICSPARRAADTLALAMAAGGWDCPVRSADTLYDGGVQGLLAEVRRERAATEVLLAVGHEPTWSDTAVFLIGGGRLRFATGALVRIDLEVERWEDAAAGAGVLAWSVAPRLLTARR